MKFEPEKHITDADLADDLRTIARDSGPDAAIRFARDLHRTTEASRDYPGGDADIWRHQELDRFLQSLDK